MEFMRRDAWIRVMLVAIRADEDTTTVDEWAKRAGWPPRKLRQLCRILSHRPKDALLLARLLRAAMLSGHHQCQMLEVLIVDDDRTFRSIERRSGIALHRPAPAARELLAQQRLVAQPALLMGLLGHLPPDWRGMTTAS